MIRILFVCLGNICRSPLAEGVFKYYLNCNNLSNSILCDSAGTAGYHIGCKPDKRSIKIAEDHGIILDHLGKKLSGTDFEDFDFIVAMDQNNYQNIMDLKKQVSGKAKVLMFRDFDPEGKGDVPDPYHGTMDDFEKVYQMCLRTSEKLANHVLADHNNNLKHF
jgi:protein-tyrosine phosphatase